MSISKSSNINRRGILKASTGAAAAALAAPYFIPARLFGAAAPSNRLSVGVIGTGNRGFQVLDMFLKQEGAQVVAVCDVNRGSYGYRDENQFCGREPAQKLVNEHYAAAKKSGNYNGCDIYSDFREVLGRKDVDAVAVVVPDHWHALLTIRACEAGKDVYCEKPLSLTVEQGRQMVHAVRKHKRVLQTGSQERSNPRTVRAIELVRSGRIGEVKKVTTFVGAHNKVGPGPGWQPMPVPDGFDYDTWLGPAPLAPYHKDRCLYRFRFNYDYSGGQVTNFGAHSNDIAQWALGADDTGPVEVELLEAKFLPVGSLFNAATETKFRMRYASGVELVCQLDKSQVGARFEGTDGMIQVGYGGVFTQPESLKTSIIGAEESGRKTSPSPSARPEHAEGTGEGRPAVSASNGGEGATQQKVSAPASNSQLDAGVAHVANFLDCIRSRQDPIAHVEIGHRSATVCHLGNIAVRLGKKKVLHWDPAAERFTNDDEANAMLTRPMRAPWRIVPT